MGGGVWRFALATALPMPLSATRAAVTTVKQEHLQHTLCVGSRGDVMRDSNQVGVVVDEVAATLGLGT